MPALNDIVSVTINIAPSAIAAQSFDTILLLPKDADIHILALTAAAPTFTFSTLADLTSAGVKPWDDVYRAAALLLQQPNAPKTMKVGLWDSDGGASAQTALTNIDSVDPNWFFAVPLSETEGDIASAGLYTETRSIPGFTYGQVSDANTLVGTGDAQTLKGLARGWTAAAWHLPPAHQFTITMSGAFASGAVINLKINANAMGAVTFDGIVLTNSNAVMGSIATNIALVSGVASAVVTTVANDTSNNLQRVITVTMNHGIYGNLNGFAVTVASTGVGATQVDLNFGPEWLNAAHVATRATTQPGSENWKFGSIVGATPDAFTTAQYAAVKAANCNYFTTFGSARIVGDGKVSNGQWIDVMRFVGWLQSNMQADLVNFLNRLAPGKEPYTDAGIAAVENVVRNRLDIGIKVGGIAPTPAYQVTMPLVANVPAATKQARELDFTFSANLAGAINSAVVVGNIVAA